MGDEAIQEQIRNEFNDLCQSRGRARERETARRSRRNSSNGIPDTTRQKDFELQFVFAEKPFRTILQAKCETVWARELAAKQFSVITKSRQRGRQCIHISITMPPMGANLANYIANELHEFDSMISANDPDNRCFDPVLEPNRTNPNERLRFSSADVLQTLKTKLQYLLPNPYGLSIRIQDAATTKYVALTPFNILRGQDPFYFKYGFQYQNLEPLRTSLLDIRWESIKSKLYFEDLTFEQRILQITDRRYSDDTRILDIFRDIPFGLESSKNERFILDHRPETRRNLYNDLSLSLSVLRAIAKDQDYTDAQLSAFGGEGNIFSAIHDPTSAEWITSSRRLALRSFRPTAEGGKRKTRRQKRYLSK